MHRTTGWQHFDGIRGSVIRWIRRYTHAHCINIVTYHTVAPTDGPFTQGMALRHTPDELAAHMAYLRRHYRPTSLRRVVEDLEAGYPLERAVVVTFDDGFRDVLTYAAPILRQFDVPMTIFPVTGVVGNTDLIWRHKLTWLVNTGHAVEVYDALRAAYAAAGCDWEADTPPPDGRELPNLYALTRRHFRAAIVNAVLDEVLARHGWSGADLARKHRVYVEPQDMRDVDPRYIEFGNHTHTHPVLSALGPDEQAAELGLARDRLKDWTGIAPLAVAYPFGERDSYNAHSMAAVKSTGHRAALDLRHRLNAGHVSPFDLSRKPAPLHDRMAFERTIEDWPAPPAQTAPRRPADHLLLTPDMFTGAPPAIRACRTGVRISDANAAALVAGSVADGGRGLA